MGKRTALSASAFAVSALLLLAGCAPGADLSPIADYGAPSYKLGGGDKIRIITFGEDQLSKEFRVDDRGNIALPLLGNLHVAGLTPEQVGGAVAEGLRRKQLIRNPSVSVEVLSYRPIYVLGEVAKPGEYPYQPGMTMLTSVAVAGGFTYRGVHDYAGVVRTVGDKAVEGRLRPNSFIAPGDVVEVFERRF